MALKINDTAAFRQYTATGGQTVFAVPFEFFENADLKVYQNTTLLTLTTHYTVTGAGIEGGGNVTLVTGATLGDTVTIVRDVAVKRVTDFPASGPFQIAALNDELARLTAMVQQQETILDSRVLRLGDFDSPGDMSDLPAKASRASQFLVFDANGNPTVSAGTDGTGGALAVALAAAAGAASLGFIQSGTGAVARTVQARLRDAVSIKDYGATGDGTTDDRAAIQACLDANAGKAIIVPNGTFAIGSNINLAANTHLIGAGGTIKMTAAASIVLSVNAGGIVIDGLTIDKNDTANPAIWGFSTSNSRITNNRILNCSAGNGILLRAQTAANGGTQDVFDNLVQGNFIDCEGAHAVGSQIGIGIDADLNGQDAATIWTASPGTLPTSTYYARNNRVIGNEIIGGNYAIGLYFATGNLISANICRDNGGGVAAPTGALRGISIQNGSSQNTIVGNQFINTQSASIHLNYGSVDNLVSANRIHNEIIDFGNAAPSSTVNGSQACIQVQSGSKRNTVTGNKVTVINDNANAGAEFFVNIGSHCDGTTVEGNEFYGAVAKAGVNLESTYHSTGAIATSYATGLGLTGSQWATAALDKVTVRGNRLHLTTAKPAIQLIQAGTISLTNVVEENNTVEGSFSTRFLKDQTTGTGSFSGRANWGNATPIEFANSETPSVFGGTLFKQTSLGYKNLTNFTDGVEGQIITIQLTGTGVFPPSTVLGTANGANFNTGLYTAEHFVQFQLVGSKWQQIGHGALALAAPAYAAGANPTKAEFDAVIDKLKSLGVFS